MDVFHSWQPIPNLCSKYNWLRIRHQTLFKIHVKNGSIIIASPAPLNEGRTNAFIYSTDRKPYALTTSPRRLSCEFSSIYVVDNLTVLCFSFGDTKYQILSRENALIVYTWLLCLSKTDTKECIFSWSYYQWTKQANSASKCFVYPDLQNNRIPNITRI